MQNTSLRKHLQMHYLLRGLNKKSDLVLTCDRGKVDANQQSEEAGDICQYILVAVGYRGVRVNNC